MKKLSSLIFFTLLSICLFAVPARPGARFVSQPNGEKIEVYAYGDEAYHYLTDKQGNLLERNAEGYLVSTGVKQTAQNIKSRRAMSTRRHAACAPKATAENFKSKGLVILANFKDLQFTTGGLKDFDDMLNGDNYTYGGATGSVRQYYSDQSSGAFKPEFKIYGPVTLSQNYSYYGQNDRRGDDTHVGAMVKEACELAIQQYDIDLEEFDIDGDGYVDFVDVLYAGYGEADYDDEDCVWPCEWSLKESDAKTVLTYGNKKIDTFSCHQELYGETGDRAGIGTACHEFGHVFGLPDFYDYEHPTLGYWDLMDGGAYNNDGRTPPSFSGYERMFAGWAEPRVLNQSEEVTLSELQGSQEILIITATGQHNLDGVFPEPEDFYILENRQATKWDKYLPGHGMLIWKIQYDVNDWYSNTPNAYDTKDQGVAIMAADGEVDYEVYQGSYYSYGDSGDPFPGTSNSGKGVTEYKKIPGYAITDIKEDNQQITFTLTVSEVPDTPVLEGEQTFVKVTSAPQDWTGTYLIVYEDMSLALDGSLSKLDAPSNTEAVTIRDNTIVADIEIAFNVTATGSGYAMCNQDGQYIGQTDTQRNGLAQSSTPFELNIQMNGQDVDIYDKSSQMHLRYNTDHGQERFRFYKQASYTKQQPIQLYRAVSGTAVDNITSAFGISTENHSIVLTGLEVNAQVTVYNISGQLVYSDTATNSDMTINVDNGVYMVRVVQNGKAETRKTMIR